MKRNNKKDQRIIALVCTVIMVLSVVPIAAFATNESKYGYSVTSSDYIEMSSQMLEGDYEASSTATVLKATRAATTLDINKTGDIIVNDKIEFEIMGISSPVAANPDQMSFFSYMEKVTNVKINFIGVAENMLGERKALVMQSGDYPDMFTFRHDTFTDYELYKYGKEGVIVDLMENDYLDNAANVIEKKSNIN